MVDLTTMSLSDKKRLARKLVEETDWTEDWKRNGYGIINLAKEGTDELQAVELLIKDPTISETTFNMMASSW